jgi:thioredoxin reductase (NADPH)
MSETHHTKVLIIGSGPAGYTAAIYAARANLAPIIVTGMEPGGQLMITTDVENYPGFADVIQGPWLMEQMKAQAEHVGTTIHNDMIKDVDFTKRPFICNAESGATYIADTVIISTGAKARWLGLPAEQKFHGLGISACATCDGFFFRGREVAVVGGGNSAVEEAMFLTNFASKVTLIHRRDSLRAEKIAQERLFANPKVEVIWDSVVEDIEGVAHGEEGTPGMTGVRLKNLKTDETTTLKVDGMFIAIGHDPATSLFRGKLEMDKEGYILTKPDSTATSIPGVYAAGDVKDKVYRQAVTAAGSGCMAALEADKFLAEHSATGQASAGDTSDMQATG